MSRLRSRTGGGRTARMKARKKKKKKRGAPAHSSKPLPSQPRACQSCLLEPSMLRWLREQRPMERPSKDLLRRLYKAHYRACTEAQFYWQPTPVDSAVCENCGSRYVVFDGYAFGLYRVLDNSKLERLEKWP